MRNRAIGVWFVLLLAGSVAGASVAGGCGAGSSSDTTDNSGGSSAVGQGTGTGGASSAGGSGLGGEGGCTFGCDTSGVGGGQPQGVLMVSPPTAALVVDNGNVQTQQFKATLNGKDVTTQVQWVFERPDIGDVNASALFTPTGTTAGAGKLTAKINQSEGSAQITVTIKKTVNTAGLSGPQQQAFDNPSGPDGSMNVVYPYQDTVFPLGVLAPEVQWNGAVNGDLYKMEFKEKYYDYVEYFSTSTPARHLISEADWTSIENSGAGAQSDPLVMTLQRMSGNTVYQPKALTLHVAQGRLHGSVYYWELPNGAGNGRILRIKPDSANVDQFFNPGVCWGCHTVSRDGKKLAAEFNDGNGPLYTLDLTANPVNYGDITPVKPSGNYVFSAFNNDGTKLLASDNNARALRIVDAVSGQTLVQNAFQNGPSPSCGEPAWSPDGKKLAGVCNMNGGFWTFDATSGNLTTADVAPDGVTVSNIQTIVQQGNLPGRPAYPSFSPGSEFIAYGRPTQGSRSTGNGMLWLVGTDGSNPKQLTAASSDNKSFNPVFAPLRAGGYFWLVFITRRDYGNEMVGTNNQQLWVTAIDDPPSAADPSHPPFYMRGQEMSQKSENAYYALDPCKEVGQGCLSGIDCCNGQCVKDPNTQQYVCGEPPPPGQCSGDYNACKVDADCCNFPSVHCIDGFCQPKPPQ